MCGEGPDILRSLDCFVGDGISGGLPSGSGVVTLVIAMLMTGGHCLLYARHCTAYFTCVI